MKKILLSTFLSCSMLSAMAQTAVLEGNTASCAIDSIKTNKLNISTGISISGSSDSTLMGCGYGYNTAYTKPNDNRDTLWSVARLSSRYNPRVYTGTGFAYTGPYLAPGGHPFVICAESSPVSGHYSGFESGGKCALPYPSKAASGWVSVYGDAGGQSSGLENAPSDGYAYERCFYICDADTLDFDINLLADDVIDSVLIDNTNLYTTSTPTLVGGYDCSAVVSIKTTKILSAGRHILRVWTHDNGAGHIALNVYGNIKSPGAKRNIIRSKFDSKCDFQPLAVHDVATSAPGFFIYPNPSNGNFMLSLQGVHSNCRLELYNINAQKINEQVLNEEKNNINLDIVPGIYFLRIVNEYGVSTQKLIIQ